MRRLIIGAAVVLLAGCIGTEDFDPVGGAASVNGSWTIDGAPPNGGACDALDANVIQVTFLDDRRPVTHTGLRFECTAGSFDTDAAGGSGAVVAAPDTPGAPWNLRFEAVDGTGTVVAVGDTQTVFVAEPTDGAAQAIVIEPYDFATSTAVATFTLDGASPLAPTCDEAGIASVELVFDPPDDVRTASSEPCVVGSVGARLRPGSYTVRLVVVRADGTRVEGEPETFTVASGQQAMLFGGAPVELSSVGGS